MEPAKDTFRRREGFIPTPKLRLLYGTGLRLLEGLRLRVKDVDFGRGQIIVHDGKGFKDRVTMLPDSLRTASDGRTPEVWQDLPHQKSPRSASQPHGLRRQSEAATALFVRRPAGPLSYRVPKGGVALRLPPHSMGSF